MVFVLLDKVKRFDMPKEVLIYQTKRQQGDKYMFTLGSLGLKTKQG